MNQTFITVEEAAPALSMSRDGLYRAVREGQLPEDWVLRIGRQIRIRAAAIGLIEADQPQKNESGEIETTDTNQRLDPPPTPTQ